MFIKLNFNTAQAPSIWFDSIYWILNNLTTNLNWVTNNSFKTNTGTANATIFFNSINVNGSAASAALIAVIKSGYFDAANSEIIYTTSDVMPLAYYYSGASPTLTIKSLIQDTSTTNSFLQLTPTTFQHATSASPTFTSNTTSAATAMVLGATNASAAQTWAAGNAFCYWAYISPTTFTWAASASPTQTRSGWYMVYETTPTNWAYSSPKQYGPFSSSQYTRLDVWNTDTNGIVPVSWINGRDSTYRPYYGLSWNYDLGFGSLTLNYNFNPRFPSSNSNTTFSVMNTLDATANTTGQWNLYGAPTVNNNSFLSSTLVTGQKVSFGTNIRGFSDQTSLGTTTNTALGTTSAGVAGTGTINYNSTSIYNGYLSTIKGNVTDTSISRSAWHGLQSASLYGPTITEYNASTSTVNAYFKWPSADVSAKGSYVLHPMVWNRADYNNIGGLISDKSGIYLFNGDYAAGDEFTVSGITYSIWPLADGWGYRVGLAVPKR